MKKQLLSVLTAALLCAAPLTAAAATGYSDVKSTDWYHDAIAAMSEQGIISGNPDGTFKPSDTVTYGDFITMATKVGTGAELPPAEAPAHWAKNYYNLALEKKYISERDVSASALDMPIPRANMAVIASNILGSSIDVSGEFYSLLQTSVRDVEAATPHEYEIIRAYGAGILSGYTDGTFRPEATLERCEAASVIWHLADENQRSIPNMEDLREKAQQEQERMENLSQEERIQEILDNGPQKISFDPAADETVDRDGRTVMKEDKAREYMDQILATLKFYGSGGKYYMTVTLPEVPAGYQVLLGVDIAYKQSLMKPIWGAHTIWTTSQGADAVIKKTGTSTIEIKSMKSLAEVYTAHVGMSINKIDDTYLGSDEASYQMQRDYDGSIDDHFAINRQGSATDVTENYPYTLDRHYIWR